MKIMNKLQNRKEELKKNNKGFSLVELIIVIAIMAILVGIVGTQVIPYISKSKVAKDQQVLNSISTAGVTAYSENGLTGDVNVDVFGTNADDDEIVNKGIIEASGFADLSKFQAALSADGKDDIEHVYFKVNATKHEAVTSVTYKAGSTVKYKIKDVKATL